MHAVPRNENLWHGWIVALPLDLFPTANLMMTVGRHSFVEGGGAAVAKETP